ncbi:hypothetical protein NOR_03730 [Metarhizium rileyi]|uniref:Uncharacterized protein n=1 Tax=Metarhizium rileyi (strain RCEF 4871) TaxID=1649241 RepID=A0A167F9W0_METRR|nr:hypothetical protein NOR_03730 [Metarhizium rileyi RCEF 4871]
MAHLKNVDSPGLTVGGEDPRYLQPGTGGHLKGFGLLQRNGLAGLDDGLSSKAARLENDTTGTPQAQWVKATSVSSFRASLGERFGKVSCTFRVRSKTVVDCPKYFHTASKLPSSAGSPRLSLPRD